jgi:hypothetical protein
MRKLSLVGQRFGRLKVVADYGITGHHHTTWVCVCDCGEQKIAYGYLLVNGHVRSCGCLRADSQMKNFVKLLRHGHFAGNRATPTYNSWTTMKQNCLNPRSTNYRFYGGRGITICEHWQDSFEAFLADMGEKPEGTMLRRFDKDRDFEPDNCEWRLKKTSRGKKLIIAGVE